MKTYIWCKLFGHKFWRQYYDTKYGANASMPVDHCVKCGLSKEEIMEIKDKKLT